MSDSECEENQPKRKKGKVNKHLHVREKEKMARRRGEEFVTKEGTLIEAKQTGPDCECRKVCTTNFSIENRESILKNLYSGRPKNEQDTFLIGLIDRFDVARHRPKNENSKEASSSYKYFAMKGNIRFPVCRQAFINLHAISNKVVSRLTNLKEDNKTPVDMRGKHPNRVNAIPPEILILIQEHISSFPTKITHYTPMPVVYLDAELSVKKMYDLFVDKFPDLSNVVKYEFYLKYFKDNFSYSFGRPQVDVCSTCEELNMKIKSSTLNEAAKRAAVAELIVHKRRAKKFYGKLQEVTELCKSREDTSAIVFDYMQNLPLPFMPVQEMFYLRKLWYYVFNITEMKNNHSVFYTYEEGTAKKGPDEVCSFVQNYVDHFIPGNIKHLHIFSDACGGQNRNHALSRFILTLTMTGRFETINQYYPIRGHSFMPCDRTFGVVKRAVKKYDRIYSPEKYVEIICNAKKTPPGFEVVVVKNEDILKYKDWWPNYYKKTCVSSGINKQKFAISKYRHLIYDSKLRGTIKTAEFIDGVVFLHFKLNKMDVVQFPIEKAYDGKVPIKKKKIEDVSTVLQYIPDEFKPFYQDRLAWPTIEAHDTDDLDD